LFPLPWCMELGLAPRTIQSHTFAQLCCVNCLSGLAVTLVVTANALIGFTSMLGMTLLLVASLIASGLVAFHWRLRSRPPRDGCLESASGDV